MLIQRRIMKFFLLVSIANSEFENRTRLKVKENRMKKYIPTTTFDSTDSCSDGLNAKYCTPPFEDITRVLKKKFEASQTCGIDQSERYCKRENEKWSCKFCDSSQTAQMLPTRHLNDHEKTTDEETCWYSGSVIEPGQQTQIRSESDLEKASTRNVTLKIDFSHPYEISFITMKFCGPVPAAMVIYKSTGNNDEWQPYQYYADNCLETFGIEPNEEITRLNQEKALCSERYSKNKEGTRVSFNTVNNRGDSSVSPVVQNWMTAQAIKIELLKPSIWPVDNNGLKTPSSTLVASYQYAISDIRVSGHCQCNGHADSCEIIDGQPKCICKHGTVGATCNMCHSFYQDRPWQRGTKANPNECRVCNCNLHTNKCKFNDSLFKMSGNQSGGMCQKCRHNTSGASCQVCKPGYTPDPNKSVDSPKYCKKIPSPEIPSPSCANMCKKHDSISLPPKEYCKKTMILKIDVKSRKTVRGKYVVYIVNIQKVYRPKKSRKSTNSRNKNPFILSSKESRSTRKKHTATSSNSPPHITKGKWEIWQNKKYAKCGCPKLRVKKTYLLLGKHKSVRHARNGSRRKFKIDRHSNSLLWRDQFDSNLKSIEALNREKKTC
ncbi:unnamed protein product [Oikopleura dioica]|uniref:Netrin-1 n=1 Tax=Oikopleura dioica TaxID=34765 RepID=E4Y4J0_OIKDI|nr:unnamed protein product [Oikopleura dioica]